MLREMPAGNAKMPHTLGMIGADSARSRRLFFNGLEGLLELGWMWQWQTDELEKHGADNGEVRDPEPDGALDRQS